MLKITARNLSDDDARKQSTVSTLTIGALIKHLAHGEENAARVITERDENAEFDMSQAMTEYEMTDGETLAGWLAEELAARGGTLVDAPLGRTPKEAEAGTLDAMVGCDEATSPTWRPLFSPWRGR